MLAGFGRDNTESTSSTATKPVTIDNYQVSFVNNLKLDQTRNRSLSSHYVQHVIAGTQQGRSSELNENLAWEFGKALIEMRACKKGLCDRSHANSLMAEAEALCEELHIEAANR